MGSSCINRPRKFLSSKNDVQLQKKIINQLQIVNIIPTIQIPLKQPTIIYPYYQPQFNLQSIFKINLYCNLKQIKKIIDYQTNQTNHLTNLLPCRSYSYSSLQSKKIFNQSPKLLSSPNTKIVQQINSNLIYRASLVESLAFGSHAPLRLQVGPQTEYIIVQKEPPTEFSSIGESTPLIPQKLLLIKQSTEDQHFLQLITKQQQIKKQLFLFSNCSRKKLNSNSLINGLLFCRVNDHQQEENLTKSQTREYDQTDSTLIYQLLSALQSKAYHEKCQGFLCYLNPLLEKRTKIAPRLQKYEYTSYLQFKSLIEQPTLDLITLFNQKLILNSPKFQLSSIYILLFALKVFMENHKQLKLIPIKFLNELLTMKQSDHKILTSVVNLMKLFYLLISYEISNLFENKCNSFTIDNCCRNILHISLVNSHVLLDAYFIQFGIQIDQKSLPIRQNPLYQPSQPLKYKSIITTKPNLRLINTLKQLSINFKQKLLFHIKFSPFQQPPKNNPQNPKKQQPLQNYTKQSLQQINKILLNQNAIKTITSLLKNKSNIYTTQYYTLDIILIMQYFLSLQLYQFIYQSMILIPNLFLITTYLPSHSAKNNSIFQTWDHIIQQFLSNHVYNFCSAELAITILTIDGLIKNMQNPNMYQQNQQLFTKALQIWLRIYRDPRAKYESFLCNSWITYIIKILKYIKSNILSNPQNIQDLHYLTNILQCYYYQNGYCKQKQPQSIQWIFNNIPISSISGILYNRIEMLLPPQDEINYSLIGANVNNSLIESLNDNISNRSNFSDSFSNAYSELRKSKKKIRKNVFDYINLPQSRAFKNGIYQWGKNINSSPLLCPLTKNLDVYKISCGNYHVVIASSMGIYGWGQNSSGQLGASSTKQPIKTIKLVMERMISSENQVQISCGNQHTAILFKEQPLVMFGQHEGGITSGSGHIFDSVSCGGLHTLGISNGRVYSWGRGEGGQLGHKPQHLKTKVKEQSTEFYLDQPKIINITQNIKKAVCGDAHSVLLTQNGDVYVFGFSYQGQLGLGITGDCEIFQIFQPVHLQFNYTKDRTPKIVDIFAGSTFTFFKTANGDILSCGLNDCNQLGQQKMMRVFNKKNYILRQTSIKQHRVGQAEYSRPRRIQLFNSQLKVSKIYCGENHCLSSVQYIKKTRMIIGWGLNKQYQISNQYLSDHITPRTIDNIYDYNFHEFCCGNNFTLGFIKDHQRITINQLINKINLLINNTILFNFQSIHY